MPPWNESSEATKTIFPLPRATMSRPSSRARMNCARQVHLEHVIPQLVGVLRRGHARDRAGVVDEDVDPLVVAADRRDEPVNLGAIRRGRSGRRRSCARAPRRRRRPRCPRSSEALTPTTSAPAAASATAAALPIPRRQPVTSAVRPERSKGAAFTRGSRPGSSSRAGLRGAPRTSPARARAARRR